MCMRIPRKIILPTNDLAFRKLFASPQNKDILIGIINDFFGLDIVDVQIANPYNFEEFNKQIDKKGLYVTTVDVVCTVADGTKYFIELQFLSVEYFIERTVYYTFEQYCANYGIKQLMKNQDIKYSSLSPTYSINILGYKHFKDNAAIHKFCLYDIENEMKLTDNDLILVGFLELPKSDTSVDPNIKYWQEFFNTGKANDNAPDYIKKAGAEIELTNFSKEERDMISRAEKTEQDALAREAYVINSARRAV